MSKSKHAVSPLLRRWIDSGKLVGYATPDGVPRPWAAYVAGPENAELFVMVQEPDGTWHMDRSDPRHHFDALEYALSLPGVMRDYAAAWHELRMKGALDKAEGHLVNRDGVFRSLPEAAVAWHEGRAAARARPAPPRAPRVAVEPVHANLFKMNRRAAKRRRR